eukprot:IDg22996t1
MGKTKQGTFVQVPSSEIANTENKSVPNLLHFGIQQHHTRHANVLCISRSNDSPQLVHPTGKKLPRIAIERGS